MHYDLIIIGGGLVGRSLACALGPTPLKIALIDASAQEQPDPRLIALNYGSVRFLESLGLWERLQARSAPIHEVHVSHRGRFGATRLNSQNVGLPSLGSVLRAQEINQALGEALRRAQQEGRFTELRPARVTSLALQEKNAALTLERQGEESRLTGGLIIAADGTHSTIRRLLSFDTQTVDYQQSALVTTTRLSRSHEHRAYERFLDEGALAMLPLKAEEGGDRLCATIWTAGTPAITALQNLEDAAFLRELQTQFGYRLGRLKSVSQRHVFPLQFIRVKNPLQGNVLLIGNAAHTIHPLAAQGLNLALYEIAHLSRLLLDNLREQRPLEAGLAEKLGHFQPKMNLLFSHYLSQIFASDFWGGNMARQLGMVGLDLCPPLEKTIRPPDGDGKYTMVDNLNMENELIALARALLAETTDAHLSRELNLGSSLQYHLGLDSLGRAELFRRIEKQWKVELPERLLVEAETLGDLLAAIQTARPAVTQQENAAGRTEKAERYGKYRAQQVVDLSRADSLVEVLMEHAQKYPDRPYIYLQNDRGGEEILTYGQLLTSSLKVANALQQRGLKPGETVAIMQPTQLGFFYTFFGVLLASGVPVPIYPPLRPHQLESYAKQEAKILNNAEIRFLVTFEQAELLSRLLQGFIPSLKEVVTVDDLLKSGHSLLLPLSANIGLIQYTSGSTNAPKGVVLTHSNLLSNIRAFGKAVEIGPQDIAVSWLPLYHDFGLIGLVLGTLYYGLPLILFSPLSFLSHPEKWLWAIHLHRGTLSAAPNFAFELCVRKIEPEMIEGLDLSSWRMAANGAETIYPKTYQRFVEKFKHYGFKTESFYPVYGLAESTVGLAVSPLHRPPRVDSIDRFAFENEKQALPIDPHSSSPEKLEIMSCGKPLPGHFIRVVDEQFQSLPERRIGQLQFQGPSSMQGYYNNPAATALARCGNWFDTGDFAYMADGEIFITGRQKDLIIKAGRNIYPSVLEEVVSDVPGVRRGCAIAFSVTAKESGTEDIVIVTETLEKNKAKRAALRVAITDALINTLDIAPDHIYFITRSCLKTSSGKLQRSACKSLYLEGKLRPAPAWVQMIKIGLKSFALKSLNVAMKGLKLVYTLYVALILILAALPLWFLIRVLPERQAGKLCRQAARFLCLLAACPVRIEGEEHLTAATPLIFAANHASYIDAVVGAAVAPVGARFIAKKETFSAPLLRDVLRKLHHMPIDRFDFQKGLEQTVKIESTLRDGHSIFIFPEGTFSYAAGLRPFKLGAFKVAAETRTPVCPIAIQGTRGILRGEQRLMRPGKIKVIVGAPVYPEGDDWQDIIQLKNKVRRFIADHCGEQSLDFSL